MKQEHINEIKAIIIFVMGIIFLTSLVSFQPNDLSWFSSNPNIPAKNFLRISGAYTGGALFFTLGYSAYFFVFSLIFLSWKTAFAPKNIPLTTAKIICFFVLFFVISSLFSLSGPNIDTEQFARGGVIGMFVVDFLLKYFGPFGAFTILLMLGALAFILTSEILLMPFIKGIFEQVHQLVSELKEKLTNKEITLAALKPNINFGNRKTTAAPVGKKEQDIDEEDEEEDDEDSADYEDEEIEETEERSETGEEIIPKIKIAPKGKKAVVKNEPEVVGEYTIPPLDLLDDPPDVPTDKIQSSLINGARLLESTLLNFGVKARVADIERGPAITRYELEPAPGVKVQKFTILSDDIALAMKASTVRVVAPIPGKNRVGIEVPNDSSASVFLKDVLSTPEFQNSKSKLSLCLGKDIAGKPMVTDLADMPHMLIAGTTGSGKTVCVNSIIMSILMNATPYEVKFVLVDPKMVEMAQYNDIPHLLCPTVTDPKKASGVLNWVVSEMESRYKKLSKVGARNIKGYNEKGFDMHYIVVIIDELADLMQVAAKGVESSITRLAQLSRAVGIHLILATQRPSVNVITGVIKANFPARISFKVASKVDSRTVLDTNGAETLLGKGDMLFMNPSDPKPTRGQGNFVSDNEINRVIQFIKDQQEPSYDENILQSQKVSAQGGSGEKDEFFDEAVRLVIETNQASVSILQRRMRLGYTRAARLIDMMEESGIVGPYVGSKPREILVDREQWLLDNMGDKNES